MIARCTEKRGRVTIVVGMQYGSEGKGSITAYLSPVVSMGLRSGGANAGHTIYFRGKKFVMRQIPSVWINPNAQLIVGVGAIISPDILFKEIEEVNALLPIKHRLFIDPRAHVITPKQQIAEMRTGLAKRIGSTSATTGEGIGTATAEKILRKASCVQAKDVAELKPYLADTVMMANQCLDRDEVVLIEGTQGFGLSLDHGRFPFVTSRDTSATALAASVGISTHESWVDVIGVTRTHPIRVAGNSGDFDPDSLELTWSDVTKRAASPKPIIEHTSVTKKIRRVATFSMQGFLNACMVNRPTEIAVTFGDYLDWSAHEKEKVTHPIEKFLGLLESASGIRVTLLKTGPQTTIDFDAYRENIFRKIG